MNGRWMLVASLVALLTVTLATSALAGATGHDRPFSGEMEGQLTFEFDWDDPECPVTTITEATGTLRHLGHATSLWSHCPPALEGQEGYTNGHVVFVAANGDHLVGEYADADGEAPFIIDVVGGTGRFADADGAISLVEFNAVGEWGPDGLPIQPWYWDGTLTGAISY